MKKLMTLMLALSFLVGTTAVFAQGDKDKDAKSDKKSKKKGGKKKADKADTEKK
jgi:hypothetical protein